MSFDIQPAVTPNNESAGKVDMSPLTLAKAQRDRLASQFHDLVIEHLILQAALKDVSEQLAGARARSGQLETPADEQPSSQQGADGDAS